ncbi:MAG: galactosyltransferase-related protein, partial [Gemmatimonadota bacterium]|nr:galactosyltransferase-related protein [Gemmatimonadota bacterium]
MNPRAIRMDVAGCGWIARTAGHILTIHACFEDEEVEFLPGDNLAVAAEDFRAAGGFDETFSHPGYEDYEFCHRWREWGGRIVYEPRAVVEHRRPTGMGSFLRQHFDYGRGAANFYRDERKPVDVRIHELPGFYGDVRDTVARHPRP